MAEKRTAGSFVKGDPRCGRPKGRKNNKTLAAEFDKELIREDLRQRVAAHLGPLVDAQIANAKGIKYLVARERKGGKFVRLDEARVKAILEGKDSEHELIEVWEKDPSVQAFTDLLNRTIDKPAETVVADVNVSGSLNIASRLAAGRLRVANARKR